MNDIIARKDVQVLRAENERLIRERDELRAAFETHADAAAVTIRDALRERDGALANFEEARQTRNYLLKTLEGMLYEWDKFTRYGSPIAKASNENVNRARAALRAISTGEG